METLNQEIKDEFYRLKSLRNSMKVINAINSGYEFHLLSSFMDIIFYGHPLNLETGLDKNIYIIICILYAICKEIKYSKNEDEILKEHPFYQSIYDEYLEVNKRVADVLDYIGKNNSLQMIGAYSYLLDNGYLSYNHNLELSKD